MCVAGPATGTNIYFSISHGLYFPLDERYSLSISVPHCTIAITSSLSVFARILRVRSTVLNSLYPSSIIGLSYYIKSFFISYY